MLPLLTLRGKVHTLFEKYLGHRMVKLEQIRMIRNFELFGKKKKWLIIFEKVLTKYLEDVS